MINTYLNITVIAEWISLIAALFLLDKKTASWRLFILLLSLVVCTETIGWYMRTALQMYSNALPFNILMLVSTLFFIWIFSKSQLLQDSKKLLVFTASVFALFGLINLFFFQGPFYYNSISEAVGDILLAILSCYFLFKTVKLEAPINLLAFDYFWLANGVLFYSSGSALFYQFSYLLRDYNKETHIDVGTYINYSLNFILYTCLIIAFICRRKATR